MKVTLYTIPDCPFSKQAKDFLAAKGIEFVEKDVQSNKDNLSEMLSASNNFAGVPLCVVEKDSGQKDVLKGFTQSDYEAVLMPQAESAAPSVPVVEAPVVESMPASEMPSAAPIAAAATAPLSADPSFTMPPVPSVPAMPETPMTPPPAAPVNDMPMTPPPAAPSTSAMPAASMPAAPAMPSAVEPLADPQDELSGLLKDLESKVDQQGLGSAPATSSAPAMPAAPTMPTSAMPAAPAMPDFPKTQ